MPSTTSKKATKNMSSFSRPINKPKRAVKVLTIRPLKGTLSTERFDAIVQEHGGRALTSEEKRQFRKFVRDPYP